MHILPHETALLLIDVQKGFDDPFWGPRNNPDAETHIGTLLKTSREKGIKVIHVQHMSRSEVSPLFPGKAGNDFKEFATPLAGELVIQKQVNSAFIGTELEFLLRQQGISTLIICGMITNHCVSTTARMAANFGFRNFIVKDAIHTFDFKDLDGQTIPAKLMHEIGLAELHGEFGEVVAASDFE